MNVGALDTINCSCGAVLHVGPAPTQPTPTKANVQASRWWPSSRLIIGLALALFYIAAYVIGLVYVHTNAWAVDGVLAPVLIALVIILGLIILGELE